IDLPRNMLINFPHLLADVNVVVVVTELTLAGARDAIRLLSWLKSNAKHAETIVVANKVHSGIGEISRSDFEASIERKINYVVPYDIKAAANAAKLGQTFVAANRASKAGAAMRDLGTAIIATGTDGEVVEVKGKGKAKDKAADKGGDAAAGKTSLLGKFDFKKILPSGKAKAGTPA
ncbi:MAG: pilus assembly protein CpaE, partial [Novosphingobium sp.]|nr:pilus assembly protein CpaE [Novosphingobium sp.]